METIYLNIYPTQEKNSMGKHVKFPNIFTVSTMIICCYFSCLYSDLLPPPKTPHLHTLIYLKLLEYSGKSFDIFS